MNYFGIFFRGETNLLFQTTRIRGTTINNPQEVSKPFSNRLFFSLHFSCWVWNQHLSIFQHRFAQSKVAIWMIRIITTTKGEGWAIPSNTTNKCSLNSNLFSMRYCSWNRNQIKVKEWRLFSQIVLSSFWKWSNQTETRKWKPNRARINPRKRNKR